MSDRQPEPWESSATGPFVTIEGEHGDVEIWALGQERFRVRSPGHEEIVTGYEAARGRARARARELGGPEDK
jgi:hypothetical protein